MVALNTVRVDETRFVYTTEGVEETKRKVDGLAKSQEGLARSGDAVSTSSERVEKRTLTVAEANARAQRQFEMNTRAVDGMDRANAAYSQNLTQMAANENRVAADRVSALDSVSNAFKKTGEFAMKHPVLVLAGAALAARGLSSLAAVAGTALGTASATTARYAATSTAMGGAVAGASAVASRGLAGASVAATATSGGLAVLATRLAALTSPLGLIAVGIGLLATTALTASGAFSDLGEKSGEIDKTSSKFEKLVELGKQAEKLDVSGPFLRNFTGLGDKVGIETDKMQAALEKAAGFVRDEFEEVNKLRQKISELQKLGYSGGIDFRASEQLDLAKNNEERIRAALTLMSELEERGHRLAAINIGEAVFGSSFTEKLRTGQMTIAQFVTDLDEAGKKQLLNQEDVQRALDLSRAIERVKNEILAVIDIRSDFSKIGIWINEWYLSALQAFKGLLDYVSQAIKNLGDQLTQSSFWKNGTWLLEKIGVKTSLTTDTAAPPTPQPTTIGSRTFPEIFGPKMPDASELRAAKKGLDEVGKAASDAADDFDKFKKKAEDAFKKLFPEEALRKQGQEMQKELDRFRDELTKEDPRLVKATEMRIALLLDGKDIDTVKNKTDDISKEMSNTFRGVFDDMFISGQKGLDGFLGSVTKGFSRIGSRLVEKNLIEPLFSGEGGGSGGKSSLFGFDLADLRKTFSAGFGEGFDKTFGPLLEPAKDSAGKSMGFASSPLGGGLTSALAGGSIGYSTQSPLMGLAGGALAGAAAYGPVGAVIGAGAGLLGGSLGHKQSKKRDRENERRQRVREFAACGDADGFVAVPA